MDGNGSAASSEPLDFYRAIMRAMSGADIPFLVGGTYALTAVTGIERATKDLDIFLRPRDRDRALAALRSAGFPAEVAFPHWLAKVYLSRETQETFVDLIYGFGNGLSEVDDGWFEHAPEAEVLGTRVRLVPPEENLWSKAFVMERERYDGADVAHLILASGDVIDWQRLIRSFGDHWRVLLSHVILFGFIYPSDRDRVPRWVLRELIDRLNAEQETPPPAEAVCQGTLLSRAQYLPDVEERGYEDVRIEPRGAMSARDVELWTEAIEPGS
jgi:hypothetical protein